MKKKSNGPVDTGQVLPNVEHGDPLKGSYIPVGSMHYDDTQKNFNLLNVGLPDEDFPALPDLEDLLEKYEVFDPEVAWYAIKERNGNIQIYPPYALPPKEKLYFCTKLDATNILDATDEAISKLRMKVKND